MNKLKTAYFAGLIDGEGYIAVKSNGAGRSLRPNIKVNMTCKTTIEALHKHFGVGSLGYRHPPTKSPHHKPQWVWSASCKSAIFVIEEILPFLITKRAVAELVLSHKFVKKAAP